ncbi:hypothetical protein D3C81_1866360 [compost metagenome]
MPCTASTSIALRSEDSRIPSCAKARRRFCNRTPGSTMTTAASSGIHTRLPAMYQNMRQKNRKNGTSATAAMVVEVSMSRTDSNSRSWDMNVPVDLGRAALRTRSA